MPSFSQISYQRLTECHHELQVLFNEVVKSFDCSIICGHRNQADQDKAIAEHKSKLSFPNSKHNLVPSMAVDVCPSPVDWKDHDRFYFFAGYVLGVSQKLFDEGKMTHKVRWGGDWNGDKKTKDNSFNDLPHFELI